MMVVVGQPLKTYGISRLKRSSLLSQKDLVMVIGEEKVPSQITSRLLLFSFLTGKQPLNLILRALSQRALIE